MSEREVREKVQGACQSVQSKRKDRPLFSYSKCPRPQEQTQAQKPQRLEFVASKTHLANLEHRQAARFLYSLNSA
eukprot:887456-Pleurochrysis_carterae.AAC.1